MPAPKAAKVYVEAARAVTLAGHAAGGVLLAAAKEHPRLRDVFMEAARLLRISEAMSRLAASVLSSRVTSATPPVGEPCPRDHAEAPADARRPRKRRQRRKKPKQNSGHDGTDLEKVQANAVAFEAAMDVTGPGDGARDAPASSASRAAELVTVASTPPSSSGTRVPRRLVSKTPAAVPPEGHGGAAQSHTRGVADPLITGPVQIPELYRTDGRGSSSPAMAFLQSRLRADGVGTMEQLLALSVEVQVSPAEEETLAVAYYAKFGGEAGG